MADINFSSNPASDAMKPEGRSPGPRAGDVRWDIIELLFFAYRDFVGDADHELEAFGFGRAHHRVLHFVHRYPGLKVADLLDVLRITKQSLGRVLKQLLDEGYIVQKTGNNDRRQRLLFASTKGEALVAKLAGLQTDRINRALRDIRPDSVDTVRQFLRAMIDHDDPDKVLVTILGSGKASTKEHA
ncbi:MAG: MarR family winged helix-turn-helix transcriptional regulator [Bradyrhizobium sp.]